MDDPISDEIVQDSMSSVESRILRGAMWFGPVGVLLGMTAALSAGSLPLTGALSFLLLVPSTIAFVVVSGLVAVRLGRQVAGSRWRRFAFFNVRSRDVASAMLTRRFVGRVLDLRPDRVVQTVMALSTPT